MAFLTPKNGVFPAMVFPSEAPGGSTDPYGIELRSKELQDASDASAYRRSQKYAIETPENPIESPELDRMTWFFGSQNLFWDSESQWLNMFSPTDPHFSPDFFDTDDEG